MRHSSFRLNRGCFPDVRLRRNRHHEWLRHLVAETHLSVRDLILPIFIREPDAPALIPSLPGILRYAEEEVIEQIGQAAALGITAVALFPYYESHQRSETVVELLTPDNLVCRTVRAIKKAFPQMGIITDVALDSYTVHGQDGIIKNGCVQNDETLEIISNYAVIQAEAGSDIIAPSEMMDGRVRAIRRALEAHGYHHTAIMSYAAKYASHFYGPFRDAVGSKGCLGRADKKSYQMNPANVIEALHEVGLDMEEGADMVMIKPGLPYLDVVARVWETFGLPTFVYQVSGEYAMLKAAAANTWLSYEECLLESLLAFKRAGARGIFTYGALDAARLIQEGRIA